MRASQFSALFGAMSNEHRVTISANNLANVNTTGYKRDSVAFQDTFVKFAHDYVVDAKPFLRDKDLFPAPKVMARVRLSGEVVDTSQGGMQKTGNPLDLAIKGDGFFQIQKDGGTYYTRNGVFTRSSEGTLVTDKGYPVMVDGGPVEIPDGSNIFVDEGGLIRVDGQAIGQLDLAQPVDPKTLKKEGENLFTINGATKPITGEVAQGYIEKSNVQVVNEMVSMIESQRSFELFTKMIQSTDQLDKRVVDRVGQVT